MTVLVFFCTPFGRDIVREYKDQVRELMSEYGKISIVWFDFSYPGGKYGKGHSDWDSAGLLKLARDLQPGIIVDNRLDLQDDPDGWDFVTPEQFKVSEWPKVDGVRVPWETCQTFSGSWGYYRDEHTWVAENELSGGDGRWLFGIAESTTGCQDPCG